jgi:hypothetical protein
MAMDEVLSCSRMEESETSGMNSENARKSNIDKWLFGVVLLWATVILVLGFLGQSANRSDLGGYVAYIGSPILVAILVGIAVHHYPATRTFLRTLVALILLGTVVNGGSFQGSRVMQHGPLLMVYQLFAFATPPSLVRLAFLLYALLSVLYVVLPQRAWGAMKNRAKLLWNRLFTGRSLGVSGHEISIL